MVGEYSVGCVGANLYKLILVEKVTREPVIVEGQASNALLIGEGDWNSISETPGLLPALGMPESIAEGMREVLDDCGGQLN